MSSNAATLTDWINDRAGADPAPMDRCPRQAEATMGVQLAPEPFWRRGNDGWVTCSYCGSLAPENLWRAVRDGMELGPTDKSYKVYVRGADVAGAGKFYFQHFPTKDRVRFVEALNAGRLSLGFPGHFSTLPFFVGRAGTKEDGHGE